MDDDAVLTVVANEAEAEVLGSRLREAGIDSTHRQTNFGAGAWDASAPQSGPQEILVAATDLNAARELLASFNA